MAHHESCEVQLHGYIRCPEKKCCCFATAEVVYQQQDANDLNAAIQATKAANPTWRVHQIFDAEAGNIVVFQDCATDLSPHCDQPMAAQKPGPAVKP